MNRRVRHSQRPCQSPHTGSGFQRQTLNLGDQLLGGNLFVPAALVFSVRDVSPGSTVVGRLQKSFPDAFARLGGDTKGPRDFLQGFLAWRAGFAFLLVLFVLGFAAFQ